MKSHNWINSLLIVVVGILVLVGDGGAGGTRFPSGLSADSTSPASGEVRGATFTSTGLVTFASGLISGAFNVNGETTTDGFTEGGGTVTVTPTSGSYTLTEANLLAGNVITFTASTTMPALTLALPATTTLTTLLASDGDKRSWIIENPFTAAATTTTISAGTGIDLQEPDGQNVVIGINNYAWLACFREASTDVVCSVSETIPAD